MGGTEKSVGRRIRSSHHIFDVALAELKAKYVEDNDRHVQCAKFRPDRTCLATQGNVIIEVASFRVAHTCVIPELVNNVNIH